MSSGLRARAQQLSAAALRAGALEPVVADLHTVSDGDLAFTVRVLRGAPKPHAPGPANPFLLPEPALTLGELAPAHRLVLNKYPAFPGHLLIVTRAFAEQEAPLDDGDVEAVFRVLDAEDALVFYNGGAKAGASQRHRHLQAVWPPLGPGPGRFPTEARLFAGELPFRVFAGRLGPDAGSLARQLDDAVAAAAGAPWNLLVTRESFALVPRRAEGAYGVPVNALGFAGSLLVRDEAVLARVREVGPTAILRAVAVPP